MIETTTSEDSETLSELPRRTGRLASRRLEPQMRATS
jgi:hypothetical protein